MKQKNILALIDAREASHATQSITRWKQGILAFESHDNPIRVLLYDMYDDLYLDGQVFCTWTKRLDAILNRRLVFVRDGEEDEDICRLLNSPEMRALLRDLMDAIMYGFTLIQVNNIYYSDDEESYRIDYDLIPRKHVHPEEHLRCVSREQYSITKDYIFDAPPLSNYMLWAGDAKDKGLFAQIAQYVIYKRGGFGDWAQFSEMFGMPFREAIYDSYDDDTRRRVEEFMKGWASSEFLVHQRDIEVKLHDTGSSAASVDVYSKLIAMCDAGISKAILGNTLTTEQGENGARSLGEVHENEQKSKEQSDEKFILAVLNTRFRACLKQFGVNVTGGEIWFENPETDWTAVQTKWNVISAVSARVPVDDDYIYEETGIPKPDNYNQLKAEQKERRRQMMQQITDSADTDDKNKKRLSARIADFFGVAPT